MDRYDRLAILTVAGVLIWVLFFVAALIERRARRRKRAAQPKETPRG